MKREFQVIDLIDSSNGRFLGTALYCPHKEDCAFYTLNNRYQSGEMLESFVEGARQVGGEINLYHINMPIEINTINTPYNEIRNTVVDKMKLRGVETNINK